MSYELKDFKKDVVEVSRNTPVVIDFWAEWCGPCRQLGPVIEKLAEEAEGQWKLVKINTEKHPDIAVQLGVRGIPAVKMVYEEEIIAEFTGAQPEHLVRKWLQENLPGNGAGPTDDLDKKLDTLVSEGSREQARALAEEEITEDSPDRLKMRLAMLKLPGDQEGAEEWSGRVEDEQKYKIELEAIEFVRHLRDVAEGTWEPDDQQGNAVGYYKGGAEALFEENYAEAIEQFIKCLQVDRSLDDDGARKACVAIFSLLGKRHPLTLKYRRQFSMSLY